MDYYEIRSKYWRAYAAPFLDYRLVPVQSIELVAIFGANKWAHAGTPATINVWARYSSYSVPELFNCVLRLGHHRRIEDYVENSLCPVLKHGPRILICVKVERYRSLRAEWKWMQFAAAANLLIERGRSEIIFFRTRKMVNCFWKEWSQWKLWWKLVALLTCKSFVIFGDRGERLIESSSSWFPPKFLTG